MKKMYFLILLLASLFACEKEADQEPLEFEIETLDGQGAPTNTFSEGDDPTFAFRITNTTNKDIVWYNWCEIFNQPELYDTYKIVTDDNGEENTLYVGKPFESPVNCPDIPLRITPGEGYYLKVPWSFNPGNERLPKGRYYITEFTITFTVNDLTAAQSFSKEFKVQEL